MFILNVLDEVFCDRKSKENKMKMSSFNARLSVLLVLFAGTMLVIAGCSSPTGSDTGGGASTINITGTAPLDASDFNGVYTVSKIVRFDVPDSDKGAYFFCLQSEGGSNTISWVVWDFDGETTGWVVPGGGPLSTNSDRTKTLPPDPDLAKVPVGESMTYEGTVSTTGLDKGNVQNYAVELEFNINEMPVETGSVQSCSPPPPPPPPSS